LVEVSTASQNWWGRDEMFWAEEEKLMAAAAAVIQGLREEVLRETGFTCSAGIADNKMLAKLTSAMHKPFQQTLLPREAIAPAGLPIDRLRGFGGDMGRQLQSALSISTCGELVKFPAQKVQ
ncbi:hypothetical protein CYMTET_36041, partial [Cymbomonas tetramitiformis]